MVTVTMPKALLVWAALTTNNTKAAMLNAAPIPWLMEFISYSARL